MGSDDNQKKKDTEKNKKVVGRHPILGKVAKKEGPKRDQKSRKWEKIGVDFRIDFWTSIFMILGGFWG